ncbi:MAG: RNA polymerase sigma factor [Solirubrobacterales bacterium]
MAGSRGRRLGTGNEARSAIASAFHYHSKDLYRFCLRRTGGDHFAAEEVAATVFLEAWRRRDEVDFASRPIQPWLYETAKNVLRNYMRTERRRRNLIESLEYVQQSHSDDASEEVARRQATRALLGSLKTLSDGQRQVVGLCLLGDSSYEAAAGDLEVPVGTVRSRLYRARLNLELAVRVTDGS